MNTLKNLGLAVFLITAAACGNGTDSNTETEKQATTNEKDTVNAYVCPMRCENSGSSQAGACPVCGMDLVQNMDFPGNNMKNVEGDVSASMDSAKSEPDSALMKTK